MLVLVASSPSLLQNLSRYPNKDHNHWLASENKRNNKSAAWERPSCIYREHDWTLQFGVVSTEIHSQKELGVHCMTYMSLFSNNSLEVIYRHAIICY